MFHSTLAPRPGYSNPANSFRVFHQLEWHSSDEAIQPHHQTSPVLTRSQSWQCRPQQGMPQIRLIPWLMWINIFQYSVNYYSGNRSTTWKYHFQQLDLDLCLPGYYTSLTQELPQPSHGATTTTPAGSAYSPQNFNCSPATYSQLQLAVRKQVNPDPQHIR